MPSNFAAWQVADRATPLEVKPAPYTAPEAHDIVIKNGAVAINPVDWALQERGTDLISFITFPSILGCDVAGEVAEIGSAVSRFKVGDRVVGLANGITSGGQQQGAFQNYTHLPDHMASPIPDNVSFEEASVLPLGMCTAASGLFQKDYLGLQHPSVPPKPTGKTLLVWGAGTSVGSNGVQLAVAAGYEVFATASPKNFAYVKETLGASQVFDYHSETVVADIIEAFKGKDSAGALACAVGSCEPCLEVIDKVDGAKFVAMAWHVPEHVPSGVGAKFIWGSSLAGNEVGPAIFVDFLPKALAAGTYKCAPKAEVVGKGLESIQTAFEAQKKGVSATKIVVSL